MELMQQVKGNYSDIREEEEGAESSRLHEEEEEEEDAGEKKVEMMELSLGRNKEERRRKEIVEKEHMFDKVVTPSDVGKLNRLVIPKQHAEKYFPLDSSSNEKGLLLNFEDRNGKMWRFRYSYWNSSQSYVMTKGWSRFVKEKKLDAGDTVSFQRGLSDFYRHRLYIDWRRRSDNPHSHHHHHHHVPDPPFFLPSSIRWYSLPPNMPIPIPPNFTFHQQHLSAPTPSHNNNNYYAENINSGSSASLYYLSSSISDQNFQARRPNNILPMIIDSVPVNLSHHNHHNQHSSGADATTSSGKRLRLFGVNMECASSAEDSKVLSSSSTVANSSSLHHLRVPHEDPLSLSSPRFRDHKGMLFDLDPSLQYHRH